jgi:hypothetical protein
MRRLREEVQINRSKLEEDLKRQFIAEKKRLLRIAVSINIQINPFLGGGEATTFKRKWTALGRDRASQRNV